MFRAEDNLYVINKLKRLNACRDINVGRTNVAGHFLVALARDSL